MTSKNFQMDMKYSKKKCEKFSGLPNLELNWKITKIILGGNFGIFLFKKISKFGLIIIFGVFTIK